MSDRPAKVPTNGLLNALWLIVLACWITLLFVLDVLVFGGIRALAGRLALGFGLAGVGITVAAILFHHSPAVKTYREQARQFHTFCKAIKKAAGTLELQQILDSAAKIVTDVTGVRGCSIKLLDSASGKLKARAVAGLERQRADAALAVAENLYQQGMMARQSIIVRDIFMRDFPAVDEQFESLICVPLHLEERLLGAVCIFGERGQRLSPEMISLLSSLGDVVSLAIAHALVYENLNILVQTKTRFMFQASHELRSPLATIQSMARTLVEGHLGDLTDRQKEMLARIDARMETLSQIVGDLLTLAVGRAELATLQTAPVDIMKLAEESVKFFESRAREKGIELRMLSRLREARIPGNEEGLRSVLTNLLSNAVKYTPGPGKVTLRLFESREQLVVEVSDTGIGIPEDEREGLFSEFYRASNAKATCGGTGLGLAIVKAIVDQHGGTVDVESEPGSGATFRVFLNKTGAVAVGRPGQTAPGE